MPEGETGTGGCEDHVHEAPPLSVALPLLSFEPGASGGGETYVKALCSELAVRPNITARTYVSAAARGEISDLDEVVVDGVAGGSRAANRVRLVFQSKARRQALTAAWQDADIVHYPLTAFVPWPTRGRRSPAVVQTLFDLQHLELPYLFSPEARLYRRRWYEAAARRADHIVTISEFSKKGIVQHLGIEPSRITVAHLGVEADIVPNLRERENFVLYPAFGSPHKNHARLIEAVAASRRAHPGLRLVLTGGGLEALGPVPDWVDVRGYVSRAELLHLYRRAAALVFPSLYEGFGLPVLEAMKSGCPVVASDLGPLPEICGGASVLVDPYDPDHIAAGVSSALEDAAALTERGVARAAQFTWLACVDEHERAYASACAAVR